MFGTALSFLFLSLHIFHTPLVSSSCFYMDLWSRFSDAGLDVCRSQCSSFSPGKTHWFKVTQASQTQPLPFFNKTHYVGAVPYRSDDNHGGTMKANTEEYI